MKAKANPPPPPTGEPWTVFQVRLSPVHREAWRAHCRALGVSMNGRILELMRRDIAAGGKDGK